MAIVLTESAAKHVKAHVAKHELGEGGLRLGVRTSGCSGLAYTVDYSSDVRDGDQVFEQHGVRVLVDRKSLPFLEGMEVDYVREGLNQRFDFRNPNVKDACGCGESFSV
ncbi:iron-sulfur cluster assembly protein [Natronocella acetinitrilica]|uniref:Iron-sulfur cluster assembly protein n=1 Tax=Natronocella acetinitrilica TaxID=414046 RepID=A0AAE3G6K1_9GAMM|nr:iron-sulfur cluster assembly accessory protein [Natronocella acetinitrilica]MCP1676352.1 iron-sulfur cluster assembly protein [Natronocella acetinitrilica]